MGHDNDRGGSAESSRLTVLLAGGANLGIGFAKLFVGLAAGSAAMLAEAAHSFADTLNQGLLLTAVQRSQKAADPEHPFGYGMERYFWSLLAAVGILVLGAGFSIYEGLDVLIVGSSDSGSPLWSYVVLGVAFLMEGTSLVRALWQLRSEAADAGVPIVRHLLGEAEPALRAVVSEDSVAILGVLLAAAGLALREATGQDAWDGVAALLIGLLLVAIAIGLGKQNQEYLIGKAADPELQRAIANQIEDTDGIDGLVELLTMRLGPGELLVAARVDLQEGGSGDAFERLADEIDAGVQEAYPEVRHVFLDPTPPAHPASDEA